MIKRIFLIFFIILLFISFGFNVFFLTSQQKSKNYSVRGTYVTGSNEEDYTYLVLQEDSKYCFYTQEKGIIEEGTYKRNNESLLLKNKGEEKKAVSEKDRIFIGNNDSVITYIKDSDLEIFINLDE